MQLTTAYKERLAKAARIATAGAMVFSSVGTAIAQPVSATALNKVSTTIDDSRPSASSVNYIISFELAGSQTTTIAQLDVEFCTTADTFGVNCTAPTGMVAPATMTSATADGFGGGTSAATFANDSANTFHVSFTGGGAENPTTAHELTIPGFTNPSVDAKTYFTRIKTYSDAGSTEIDQGTSAFAIVKKVTVSGRVLEQMTFTVAGVTNTTQCGTGDTATITTTATAVNFGNFDSGTPVVGCQKVKTATNAVNGFQTIIREVNRGTAPQGGMCRQTAANCNSDGGQSGVAAADVIVDTGLTSTPDAWGTGTTFGLGVNANGTEADGDFTLATDYRSLFGTDDIQIADSNLAPSAGVDTYVVFKADVPATQTAGVYQNTLEYVSTPTF